LWQDVHGREREQFRKPLDRLKIADQNTAPLRGILKRCAIRAVAADNELNITAVSAPVSRLDDDLNTLFCSDVSGIKHDVRPVDPPFLPVRGFPVLAAGDRRIRPVPELADVLRNNLLCGEPRAHCGRDAADAIAAQRPAFDDPQQCCTEPAARQQTGSLRHVHLKILDMDPQRAPDADSEDPRDDRRHERGRNRDDDIRPTLPTRPIRRAHHQHGKAEMVESAKPAAGD